MPALTGAAASGDLHLSLSLTAALTPPMAETGHLEGKVGLINRLHVARLRWDTTRASEVGTQR
jgi:hypothetical protein